MVASESFCEETRSRLFAGGKRRVSAPIFFRILRATWQPDLRSSRPSLLTCHELVRAEQQQPSDVASFAWRVGRWTVREAQVGAVSTSGASALDVRSFTGLR
jgi:hypothetical protein